MMNTTNYSLADESRQNLLAMYSDIHKDAVGFRPRDWETVSQKTNDEIVKDIEYYSKLADEEIELERKHQAEQRARWTAHIEGIMQDNGVNRATALRWDMDAMGAVGDVGYYCYLWSLGYELEGEIANEIKTCG